MEGLVSTTGSGNDPDHFDLVRLKEVHLPPGTWLSLCLCTVFVFVNSSGVAIVGVAGIAAANSTGLIGWFTIGYVNGFGRSVLFNALNSIHCLTYHNRVSLLSICHQNRFWLTGRTIHSHHHIYRWQWIQSSDGVHRTTIPESRGALTDADMTCRLLKDHIMVIMVILYNCIIIGVQCIV